MNPVALISRSRFRAIWQTFSISLLLVVLLEIWRPLFFLSDDNLVCVLPLITGMGRNLAQGQSPFVNNYLFGGEYNLLNDPAMLWMWNPLIFVLSLLGNTSFYLYIVDLFCALNLILSAVLFACLLHQIRSYYSLPLADVTLVFLSLSYTFSSYALVVGSAWSMFIANQALLPLIIMGLLHQNHRIGLSMVTIGAMYSFMMGHLSPFLFSFLFLTIFVLGWCISEKNKVPLFRWIIGCASAALLASPILWFALQGFMASSRQDRLPVAMTSNFSVSPLLFSTTLFTGYIGALLCSLTGLAKVVNYQAFPSCMASFLVIPAMNFPALRQNFQIRRNKNARMSVAAEQISKPQSALQRSQRTLEWSAAIVAAVVIVFVARPYWLGLILSYLPLFRSLRWPFREIFNFLFFFHLWLALRCRFLIGWNFTKSAIAGAILFLIPLLFLTPFSFTPMQRDKNLLVSGEAHRYWEQVKQEIEPEDEIITVVPPHLLTAEALNQIPFSLLGAYNYPALFEVRAVGGYTAPGLTREGKRKAKPYFWPNIYSPEAARSMIKEDNRIKALEIVSLRPLKIQLVTANSQKPLTLPPSLANGLPVN